MRWIALMSLPMSLAMSGCMGALDAVGPEHVTITSAQYQRAFDAAIDAAREMGYKTEVVDRSNGIIESDVRHAGGALEPWRIDNAGVSEVGANTTANRRRRIRIEFIPVEATVASTESDDVLRGPAIPGSARAQERFDVRRCTGNITVDVWVYLERSFIEGTKPSTYSGSLASVWTNRLNAKPVDATDDSTRDRSRWTPMERDDAYERTIAAKIEAALKEPKAVVGMVQ
ncbi:MAG: hypothetical protein EXS15_07700 [Phycisphaerales bacterium]|nr:hypothetical protein [Phycisphaerales bacterium]